jgi:hypothetical protein
MAIASYYDTTAPNLGQFEPGCPSGIDHRISGPNPGAQYACRTRMTLFWQRLSRSSRSASCSPLRATLIYEMVGARSLGSWAHRHIAGCEVSQLLGWPLLGEDVQERHCVASASWQSLRRLPFAGATTLAGRGVRPPFTEPTSTNFQPDGSPLNSVHFRFSCCPRPHPAIAMVV